MTTLDVSDIYRAIKELRAMAAQLRDGDEVGDGITYRLIDGKVFYEFSEECLRDIHRNAGCRGCAMFNCQPEAAA